MAGIFAQFQDAPGKDAITREFLHRLEDALLLALQEQGRLNLTQYHRAREWLDRYYQGQP